MAGLVPIGAKLRRYHTAFFSLAPCGGGSGWGVVTRGNTVPHLPTPTPDPSPQGGGEKRTAISHLNLAPMGTSPAMTMRHAAYGRAMRRLTHSSTAGNCCAEKSASVMMRS